MASTLAMSPMLITSSPRLLITPSVSQAQDLNVGINSVLSRASPFFIRISILTIETGFYSKQGSECKSGMVFALNPSGSQTFSTFRQNALNTNSGSSGGLSGGAKAGAAVGSIAGAALIFAALFYIFRRHRNKHSAPVTSPEDGSDNKPAMIGTGEGQWPAEHKPDLPPKGAELHDQSTPGELNAVDNPSELHVGDGSHLGSQSEPAEMWSPTSTMVSHERQNSMGFGQISPDERSER